jgi:hypothetical protein
MCGSTSNTCALYAGVAVATLSHSGMDLARGGQTEIIGITCGGWWWGGGGIQHATCMGEDGCAAWRNQLAWVRWRIQRGRTCFVDHESGREVDHLQNYPQFLDHNRTWTSH